ncbi:MAG TPA: hypothetical protein VFO16_12890 [Pseudonocardiaceae bacterium]|nr:hypothetical protein [Pseudonocardiaceae bacterium]
MGARRAGSRAATVRRRAGLPVPARGWRPATARADLGHRAPERAAIDGSLHRSAAMLLNARADVLAWNPMGAALLRDFSALQTTRRNIVWQRFAGAGPGRLVADAEEREHLDRASVADLRASAARYPGDPRLHRMISELRARSPEFARLWALRPMGAQHPDRKRFAHPQLGVLELDCDALVVPGDDQVLIVYSATPAAQTPTRWRCCGSSASSRWPRLGIPEPNA